MPIETPIEEITITPQENLFKPFAENAVIPENRMDNETYENCIRRETGFVAGEPADNALMNTVLRSATVAIKGLTDLIAENGTLVPVDVDAYTIRNGLQQAINNMIGSRVIEVITPIIEKMQKQINNYANAYHGLPVGGIIPIACTEAELDDFLEEYPYFHVCDGTEGTIDLRDRFIMSTGITNESGDKGGSRSCGCYEIEETSLNIEQMPMHGHEVPGSTQSHLIEKWPFGAPKDTAKTYIGSSGEDGQRVYCSPTGKGKGHTHKIIDKTATNDANRAQGNLPPYFALIFVQKIRKY